MSKIFQARKPSIWSWQLGACEPGGLRKADSARGFCHCLQDLASSSICVLLWQQPFPTSFASWPGKRDWARDGCTELSPSWCFCCMNHILSASGIIPPAASVICPFVSIYRLKRRVPVLLLMGLQTAWVELSTWIFTVFGDMGEEHFLLGMQITRVHCESAWPSYLLFPLFSCEFSKCKEPYFPLERLSMIHWKEKEGGGQSSSPSPCNILAGSSANLQWISFPGLMQIPVGGKKPHRFEEKKVSAL